MKHLFLTASLAVASLSAFANRPDSVWVRPEVNNGSRSMQNSFQISRMDRWA